MNGLKKLRQTLRRNSNKTRNNKPLNEVYIYTPLPDHKNGYIIEFRHSNSSEIYYYKYKEIAGGTLTKYGYLVCEHHNRNYDNSKYYKNNTREIDYKTLFSVNSNDKECIFYQTVADKEQIALEKRWMNELREKGKLLISACDDNGEWSTLMQHNNDYIISDNIQRRRLDEILNKIDLNNDIPTRTFPPLSVHQLSNGNNSLKENDENDENYNYNNYYEYYTPPLSPKTPPSSPTENFANFASKSLLNMNIRQRDKTKEKKYQEEQQQSKEKVKKLIHLAQPKFRKTPMVYTYDPEDALEYKDCRCDYCLIDDYYE